MSNFHISLIWLTSLRLWEQRQTMQNCLLVSWLNLLINQSTFLIFRKYIKFLSAWSLGKIDPNFNQNWYSTTKVMILCIVYLCVYFFLCSFGPSKFHSWPFQSLDHQNVKCQNCLRKSFGLTYNKIIKFFLHYFVYFYFFNRINNLDAKWKFH